MSSTTTMVGWSAAACSKTAVTASSVRRRSPSDVRRSLYSGSRQPMAGAPGPAHAATSPWLVCARRSRSAPITGAHPRPSPPSGTHWPRITRAPPACRATNVSIRVVLPTPASPPTSTVAARPAWTSVQMLARSSSWSFRPTTLIGAPRNATSVIQPPLLSASLVRSAHSVRPSSWSGCAALNHAAGQQAGLSPQARGLPPPPAPPTESYRGTSRDRRLRHLAANVGRRAGAGGPPIGSGRRSRAGPAGAGGRVRC